MEEAKRPRGKVKAHQPPPDPDQQSTDRGGGGMSGKLKKKILKTKRKKNTARRKQQENEHDIEEVLVALEEIAIGDVDGTADEGGNVPPQPPLKPLESKSKSESKSSPLKNLLDQFHQLPSLNSAASSKLRAAQAKKNPKKPLTKVDIRTINLWCELALKSIPLSPSFSFLQQAFQSGPYSGGTPFNVNRLRNAHPTSPYLKTLSDVSLTTLKSFSGGTERQNEKVNEVVRKIERNQSSRGGGSHSNKSGPNTSAGVTDWNNPENAAKLEKSYSSKTSVNQRKWIFSKIGSNARVLDYGCGPGYLLEMFGDDSVGADTSEAMCEMSRKRNPGKAVVHLELEDGRDVSREFEEKFFDCIVVCQVLLYMESPMEAIRRLHRLLKPEGKLILVETDWDSLIVDIEDRELFNTVKRNCLRTFLDPHMGRKLVGLMSEGFDVVDVDSFNMNSTGKDTNDFMHNWAFKTVPNKLGKFEVEEKIVQEWLAVMEEKQKKRKFYCSLDRSMVVGSRRDWIESDDSSSDDSDDESV
ncbi:hypothetical protein TrST_g11157 [Triparma strigata]|uniref:Methyltransferase type 11 domain-containing protein n=1 Tax=Triparma strigata TaxID=1606541 RepID=A0A9W7BEE4_9STRA|nr:hypothetical protein TrST_g11157 [Triparma strigata]